MFLFMKSSKFVQQHANIFTTRKLLYLLIGTVLISFGLYNIHQQTNITEGGILGLTLLLNHWFGIAPSLSTILLDIVCYVLAFRFIGSEFFKASVVASLFLAGLFRVWEQFPPLLPDLSSYPFFAAIIGGVMVGTGVGLVVRQGGASSGDDALALTISKFIRCRISIAYLITDLSVLLLSLSYIPLNRMFYSLLTVTVSSIVIDLIQQIGKEKSSSFANATSSLTKG